LQQAFEESADWVLVLMNLRLFKLARFYVQAPCLHKSNQVVNKKKSISLNCRHPQFWNLSVFE